MTFNDSSTGIGTAELSFYAENEASYSLSDIGSAGSQAGSLIVTELSGSYAPETISSTTFSAAILDGRGPFADSGTYDAYFAQTISAYVLLGSPSVVDSAGAFSYGRTSPNTAELVFYDSSAEYGTASLIFYGQTSGVYFLTSPDGTGYQRGVFATAAMPTNRAPMSLPAASAVAVIASGAYPFANTGSFELIMDQASGTYLLIGDEYVNNSSGTYVYHKVSGSNATINVNDVLLGSGRLELTFEAPFLARYEFFSDVFGTSQSGFMSFS